MKLDIRESAIEDLKQFEKQIQKQIRDKIEELKDGTLGEDTSLLSNYKTSQHTSPDLEGQT